jgi:hypothetical protein
LHPLTLSQVVEQSKGAPALMMLYLHQLHNYPLHISLQSTMHINSAVIDKQRSLCKTSQGGRLSEL